MLINIRNGMAWLSTGEVSLWFAITPFETVW